MSTKKKKRPVAPGLITRKILVAGGLILAVVSVFLFSQWRQQLLLAQPTPPDQIPDQTNSDSRILPTTAPPGQLDLTPTPGPTLRALPQSKVLTGGNQIFQTFNNCGPASLSMALSHLGVTRSQAQLGQQLRPFQNQFGDNDDKSVTLTELATKAEEFGFVVFHRPAGSIELIQRMVVEDIPVITRTWLQPNEDIGHYRVVKGFDRSREVLIQDDSLQGANLSYAYDDFLELWEAFNYEFMVLVPAEKAPVVRQILAELDNETVAWQQALALSEQLEAQDPSNVYYQFNQLVALYKLGRYEEARVIYERVADRLPSRMLWYQIEPILVYYRLGDYDRVLAMTDQILENGNYSFSELHQLRGLIFQERGQAALAQQSFDLATQFNSTSQIWMENLR